LGYRIPTFQEPVLFPALSIQMMGTAIHKLLRVNSRY